MEQMTISSRRPRNVNAFQAAAILYGDWGTSKAYVIGLAFALAGYQAFWPILAVSILMGIVGLNYITICRLSPSGGGVYSSARKHSEALALVGAFFLIADYLITASLSAMSCFEYLGVEHPAFWAIGSIVFIGVMNFFGPRHTGNIALMISCVTIIVVLLLGIISLPYLPTAIAGIRAPSGGFLHNWSYFVGMIVALSGIEAVANTTGVMQLDAGSSEATPQVHTTSKKAILMVMAEVCFFTAFFGLMTGALSGLQILPDGDVQAPDGTLVRDSMLKYMGETFITGFGGGATAAAAVGHLISITFAILLLSAVNTAMVALISLFFVISRDGEMPASFQTLTPFGVPRLPLVIATLAPATILLFVHDVASLAHLYAVGFVGAIATNLGVNGWCDHQAMSAWSRWAMRITCLVMIAIEITLLIEKPEARRFALTVIAFGLLLRMFVIEQRQKQWVEKRVSERHSSLFIDDMQTPLHEGAMLCAVRTSGKTLKFAMEEARRYHQPLYILFIREQKVLTDQDQNRMWLDDPEACRIFDYAKDSAQEISLKFLYTVSAHPSETIVEFAARLKASRVILGRPRQSVMLQILRGNMVQEISQVLPPEIDLLVIS